jgi:DNA topoisomerase-1
MGIDLIHDFAPTYEISPEKKRVVRELKAAAKNASKVWIATDEDRE